MVDCRRGNLEKFKRREAQFLICTAVAARGIDVKNLPYAINFTLPETKAEYLHRVRLAYDILQGFFLSTCLAVFTIQNGVRMSICTFIIL